MIKNELLKFDFFSNKHIHKRTLIPRIRIFRGCRRHHFFHLLLISRGNIPTHQLLIQSPHVGKGNSKGPISLPSVTFTYSPSLPGTHPFTYNKLRFGSILMSFNQFPPNGLPSCSAQYSVYYPYDQASSFP